MDNNPNNMQPSASPMPNMVAQQPATGMETQPVQNVGTQQPIPAPVSIPNQSSSSLSIKGIILTITNALGAICFFLPWVTVSALGISQSANGSEIGNNYRYMGYAVLILFVIAATLTGTKIMNKQSFIHKICVSVVSGIAALLSVILIIIIFNDLGGYGSAGIGLWLCAIVGAASAAIAWIPIKGE